MELQSPATLVLCGKSAAENELARCLKSSNSLQLPDGSPVNVVLNSEIECRDRTGNDEIFCLRSYMSLLSTSRFGRLLVYSPKLASTHDVVSQKENFEELPAGGVCVADVQFKGRGRSKNVWESPKGCLMFSFTIQMEDGRVVPMVQYVVSLAMTEAINDVCRKDVKAGIGLNVGNQEPTTCLNSVLQRLTPFAHQLQLENIISAFFNKFESFYDIFINQGFQTLEELYYKTWLHSGQRVIVQEKNEKRESISEDVVIIQGLTTSGYLLAVTEDGQTCELHPDGNSFDFFKGLVRRKLT